MKGRDSSLHIGLNSNGLPGRVSGDGADLAWQLAEMAQRKGLIAETLLGSDATADAVKGALSRYAANLRSGDLLLVTYVGHGKEVDDTDHDELPGDTQDEAWVLWDRDLLDDELQVAWTAFDAGVEIRVIADTCHSGTPLALGGGKPRPSAGEVICSPHTVPRELDRLPPGTRRPRHDGLPGGARRDPSGQSSPRQRCWVYGLGAASDSTTATFGRLSRKTLEILADWEKTNRSGTWEELRAELTQRYRKNGYSPPVMSSLPGQGNVSDMASTLAFSPRR